MKNPVLTFTILFSFLFTACQSDEARQDAFVGKYEVSLDAPAAHHELSEAKEEMQSELDEARKEIRREMAQAREDIEAEFGDDNDFGKAIGSFVEGIGHFAEGMTELGESLGELGIDLGTGILKDVRFVAEFQPDGDVKFGRRSHIRFNGNGELKWKIEGDKMYLWNEDEKIENAEAFKMEKISDSEWDLVGEEVIFHLRRMEEER